METENDILEETLSIADDGYVLAYDYLLKKYEKNNIQMKIFCGSCDENCLPMAEHLFAPD